MNNIPDIITSYLKFCGENTVGFELVRDGNKNYVKYIPNKKLTMCIGNPNDKDLEKMLLEELKKILH